MTEIEALKILKRDLAIQIENKALPDGINAITTAIQALEEVSQYRAIGTVEELINTQIREKVLNVEVQSYKEIGTIEEFKAYKSGDCMNNCEHYDNCANYIYSKGYNQGTIDRAEELQKCREYGYKKAIDECIKIIEETVWKDTDMLVESIRELKGGAT